MPVARAVEDLYRARWGEPTRRAHFDDGEHVVEVLKWDEAATTEGVTLYATAGASTSVVPDGAEGHKTEFILGLSPPRDDVASPLAALGLYAAHNRSALDHGHTVPSDQPLWSGTTMSAFLVARPLPDFLPPLLFPNNLHVDFLQAIPIFDSERAYKSRHGIEALLKLWEDSLVPFWDPDREPHPK